MPDGYGNSYFWVKPPRIVPADRVRTVGGRLAIARRRDPAVRRGRRGRGGPLVPRGRASPRSASASCTPTPTRPTSGGCARCSPASTRTPWSRSRSEVLREYREYERAVTTLVDAAVKPRHPPYVANIAGHLDAARRRHRGAVLRDEVQRRRARRPRRSCTSRSPPCCPGPAAGALGAALVARAAGFDAGAHLRRRRHVDRRDASCVDGEPTLTTEGTVGALPEQDPDDRRRHGRRRRRLGRLALARGHAQGRAASRPAPTRARSATAAAATEPTVTDAHVRARPDPAAPARRRDPARRRPAADGPGRPRRPARARPRAARATGILEISAWNQANALRQVTVKRGLDVRDFTLATFGGSGSLLACRLIDILGLPAVLVPRDPGQPVGVRAAHRRRPQRLRADRASRRHADLDRDRRAAVLDDAARRRPTRRWTGEGFAATSTACSCARADLRYFGQAFEVRVPCPTGRSTDALAEPRSPTPSTTRTSSSTATTSATTRGRQVEWVNLRVTGVGPIRAAGCAELAAGTAAPDRAHRQPPGVLRRLGRRPPSTTGPTSAPATWSTGPAVIEEFGSTVPLHPGFTAPGRRLRQPACVTEDPVTDRDA